MIESESNQGRLVKKSRQSAHRIAILEFVTVFVSALCWNFFRKTGESIFDSFGIAAVTALLLYVFEREREK